MQLNGTADAAGVFQFPVGMSNRSYLVNPEIASELVKFFQFPVGMSNRSYTHSSL